MFERGDTVECVNDNFSNVLSNKKMDIWLDHIVFPKKGHYYVIRDLIPFPEKNTTGILLEEIINPRCYPLRGLVVELNFDEKRFRKVEVDLREMLEVLENVVSV